jgi:hypothetical protein
MHYEVEAGPARGRAVDWRLRAGFGLLPQKFSIRGKTPGFIRKCTPLNDGRFCAVVVQGRAHRLRFDQLLWGADQ